jgi:hypothetical protein
VRATRFCRDDRARFEHAGVVQPGGGSRAGFHPHHDRGSPLAATRSAQMVVAGAVPVPRSGWTCWPVAGVADRLRVVATIEDSSERFSPTSGCRPRSRRPGHRPATWPTGAEPVRA